MLTLPAAASRRARRPLSPRPSRPARSDPRSTPVVTAARVAGRTRRREAAPPGGPRGEAAARRDGQGRPGTERNEGRAPRAFIPLPSLTDTDL